MDNILTKIQEYLLKKWRLFFFIIAVFCISQVGGWTSVSAFYTDVSGSSPYTYTSLTPPVLEWEGDNAREAWNYKVLPDITADTLKLGVKYTFIDDSSGDPLAEQPQVCPIDTGVGFILTLYPLDTLNLSDIDITESVSLPYISGDVTYKYNTSNDTGTYNSYTGACEYDLYYTSSTTASALATSIIAGNYYAVLGSAPSISDDDTIAFRLRGSPSPNIEQWKITMSDSPYTVYSMNPPLGVESLPNLDFYINAVDAESGGGNEYLSSCNPFSTNFSNAFLNPTFSVGTCLNGIFSYLFVPSSSTLSQFSNLSLATKFPFSYAYDVGALYNELFANSGSSEINLSVTTGIGTITFLTADMIEVIPYTSTIKTILSALLYFFTAMTIYKSILLIFRK